MPRPRPLPGPLEPLTGRPVLPVDAPVLGFRAWRATTDGELRAVTAHDYAWTPGPNRAQSCDPGHAAPGDRCHCGFNAFSDPWTLRRSYYSPEQAASPEPDVIVGAVAQWGTAHAHHTGVRSEYAQVVALKRPASPHLAGSARRAASRYRVPLIDTDRDLVAFALEHARPLPDSTVPLEPLSLIRATLVPLEAPPADTPPGLRAAAMRGWRWAVAATMVPWAIEETLEASRRQPQRMLWELRANLLGCLNAAATSDPWRAAHGEMRHASRTLARCALTFSDAQPAGSPVSRTPRPLLEFYEIDDRQRARAAAALLRHREHFGTATVTQAASMVEPGVMRRAAAGDIVDDMLRDARVDCLDAVSLLGLGCPHDRLLAHPGLTVPARLHVHAAACGFDLDRLLADPLSRGLFDDPRAAEVPFPMLTMLPVFAELCRRHGPGGICDAALAELCCADDPHVARTCLDELERRGPRAVERVDPHAIAAAHPRLAARCDRMFRSLPLTRRVQACLRPWTAQAEVAITDRDRAQTLALTSRPDVAAETLNHLDALSRTTSPDAADAASLRDNLAKACAQAGWDDEQAVMFARHVFPAIGATRPVYLQAVRAGHNPAGQAYLLTGDDLAAVLPGLLARPADTPDAERDLAIVLCTVADRAASVPDRLVELACAKAREQLAKGPVTVMLRSACEHLVDKTGR